MQLILMAARQGLTVACTQLGGLHPSARDHRRRRGSNKASENHQVHTETDMLTQTSADKFRPKHFNVCPLKARTLWKTMDGGGGSSLTRLYCFNAATQKKNKEETSTQLNGLFVWIKDQLQLSFDQFSKYINISKRCQKKKKRYQSQNSYCDQ